MPVFRAVGLCGNMVMAVFIASPKIICRSEAIERMASSTSWWFRGAIFCSCVSLSDNVSSSVRAMANARALAGAESTATLERHVSMSGSGTGNLNVWTLGGMEGGGAVSVLVRTGRRMFPRTLLSSRNEVVRAVVPPTWDASCPGSQIVR